MFQKRIQDKKPIYLHEFLYPVAQGYDSVEMEVDLEVGGNDQMFNMMAGRDLMKAMKGKEKFVLTMKLLADDAGKKMGKSEGNAVFLDESPQNMFGIIMTWPDGVIGTAFELCTKVSMEKVLEIKEKLKDEKNNPRDFKMELAYEITKIVHGEAEAQKAREYFVNTFSKRETPEEIAELKVDKEKIAITEFLVLAGLADSKSDARRKIEQGGVAMNGKKVVDWQLVLDKENNSAVLKVGKFGFVKIKF
jgi:tyrosyl-tRNA synthetase